MRYADVTDMISTSSPYVIHLLMDHRMNGSFYRNLEKSPSFNGSLNEWIIQFYRNLEKSFSLFLRGTGTVLCLGPQSAGVLYWTVYISVGYRLSGAYILSPPGPIWVILHPQSASLCYRHRQNERQTDTTIKQYTPLFLFKDWVLRSK